MHRLAPVDLCDDEEEDLSLYRRDIFLAVSMPIEAHFLQSPPVSQQVVFDTYHFEVRLPLAMLSSLDGRAPKLKLDIDDTRLAASAPPEETFEVIPLDYQCISVKRRRVDEGYDVIQQAVDRMNGGLLKPGAPRTFLTVRHSAYVFHTEDWKPRGCNMYLPLTQDVMLNVRRVEQISFENDQFFLADGKGNYAGAKTGNAVHLWKMDPNSRKLYISRSLLFLRDQEYRDVQQQLASL